MKTGLFISIVCFMLSVSVQAIITGNDTVAESDPLGSTGFNWDYIYNYKNASSAAVDPYWILTAAHVADDGGAGTLLIDGTNYLQQEIVYHGTADLALVRYDKEFPGYYNRFAGTYTAGDDFMVTGYGNTGSDFGTFFTDSGSGSGTKRWGENEYDSSSTQIYDAGGLTGMTTNEMFYMGFNSSVGLPQEAGVGVYDSGGGSFIDDGGEWKLAGINTIRSGGPAYTGTYAVDVNEYETWINETVPEPATAILLIGVAALLGVAHRIRCMME